MDPELKQAIRTGRFTDASRILERYSHNRDNFSLERLEVDYFLGRLGRVANHASEVLRQDVSPMVRCRCASFLAAVHWDLGDLSESLML
jgi:hypothetical protein